MIILVVGGGGSELRTAMSISRIGFTFRIQTPERGKTFSEHDGILFEGDETFMPSSKVAGDLN